MPRITPLKREEIAEYEPLFQQLEEFFGFLPNDYLTMGHKPHILKAINELTGAVIFAPGKTPIALRLLVAYRSSRSAQCMYCVAHCGALAIEQGLPLEQIQNITQYETHESFSPMERAALKVADKAGKTPNEITDQDFNELRFFFDEEACAELTAVIALMGFYNRWNDTLATTLEKPPMDAGLKFLKPIGWTAEKHVS